MTRSSAGSLPPPINGKLWIGAAAIMALFPGKTRRAAVHGLIAQAVASAVTNAVFKTLLPRTRPLPEHLPVFRFVHPQPTSSSMPSGHSASAIAFAVGTGLVRPALGAALAPAALGVAYSRVHTGAHWPSDVFFGSAIGAGAALVTRKWWPVRPPFPEVGARRNGCPGTAGGHGLSIVVNTLGGSYKEETAAALQEVFPQAYIKTVDPEESLEDADSDHCQRPAPWPSVSGAVTEPSAQRRRPPSNIPFPCWCCPAAH